MFTNPRIKKSQSTKQLQFADFQTKQERKNILKFKNGFGGESQLGHRKDKRPLSDSKPIHLILKSNSVRLFTHSNKSLVKLIHKIAEKYSVKIYDLALNHTHIHFVLKLKTIESYNRFIRELTSKMSFLIRRQLIEAKDSLILDLKSILDHRPFTRIIQWGKDFRNVYNYVFMNILEAEGLVRRSKLRKAPYKKIIY